MCRPYLKIVRLKEHVLLMRLPAIITKRNDATTRKNVFSRTGITITDAIVRINIKKNVCSDRPKFLKFEIPNVLRIGISKLLVSFKNHNRKRFKIQKKKTLILNEDKKKKSISSREKIDVFKTYTLILFFQFR